MPAKVKILDVIDLSDGGALTTNEIDERHEELARIGRKIEALKMREHVLECELGLERATKLDVDLDLDDLDTQLFLDDRVDAFEATPAPSRQDASADFEIDDTDFDLRFAAFASSDDEGDHAARRWFRT